MKVFDSDVIKWERLICDIENHIGIVYFPFLILRSYILNVLSNVVFCLQRTVLHMLYTTKMATINKGRTAAVAAMGNGDRVLRKMVTRLSCPVNMNRQNNRLNKRLNRRLHRLYHHRIPTPTIRYKVCTLQSVRRGSHCF